MEQFIKVLAEFEDLGGKGIVYGGCLRDTVTGYGPVKDIDIAVQNTKDNLLAIVAFYTTYGSSHLEQYIGYGNFPDVFASVQVERPDAPTVNFVVLSDDFPFTPTDVAERCDFGICQIAMDSFGLTYRTGAFAADLANYTFTYTREPFDQAQFERSLRRWDRFSQRYVGWRLVVPAYDTFGLALAS